jgi:diaminopimelate epimerase
MGQQINFTKMHGLGNDFVVIDNIHQNVCLSDDLIKKFSDRHCGIGFDQLLLIEKSQHTDLACRIFNANGSEAQQCGNGMRCIGRFAYEKHLISTKSFCIETKAGIIAITIHDYDHIEVTMGLPIFDPEKIPFLTQTQQSLYPIPIDSIHTMKMAVLSMGNPHAIFFVASVKDCPIHHLGPALTQHPVFPQGVNTGFVEIIDRKHIRLRTYERGVGETLACGSNACAAVVAGIINGYLDNSVNVELQLGQLTIEWKGNSHPVTMSGPASDVFDGVINLI